MKKIIQPCNIIPKLFISEVPRDYYECKIIEIPESLIITEYTMHIENNLIKEVYINVPHTNADEETNELCFNFNTLEGYTPTIKDQQKGIERILSAYYAHGMRSIDDEDDSVFDLVIIGEKCTLGSLRKEKCETKVVKGR